MTSITAKIKEKDVSKSKLITSEARKKNFGPRELKTPNFKE